MTKVYFEKLNKAVNKFSKPPTPSNATMPMWWKDSEYYLESKGNLSPIKHRNFGTIKSCPAILDSISYGYILYTPTDLYVDATKENIEWIFPEMEFSEEPLDFSDYISYHNNDQLSKYVSPGYHKDILKINTFWGIKTDPGYSSIIMHPQNRDDLPFRTFFAIVDTDLFPARFPYPIAIRDGFSGIIKAGTPLIQVLPFKRESFTSENIEVSKEEIKEQTNALNIFFTGAYKKIYWNRKKFK